ncbi:MAG: hypothetical protein IT377_19315 [Polyangiaceae bacterium]|nr:hypothetical protein [Polyangiaceae bacterium]
MGSRLLGSLVLGASAALSAACLDIAPTEPDPGQGGSGGGNVGGAAGWPGSGGNSGLGGSAGAGGTSAGGTSAGGTSAGGTSAGGTGAGGTAASGGGAGFAVKAVAFDGVQDWLENATAFQGVADTKTVTGSLWFKRVGLGKTQCLGPEAAGSGSPNQLEFSSNDSFRVVWRKAGGGLACDLSTTAITDTTSWHHVAFSVDLSSVAKKHLYLDGASSISTAYYADTMLDNTGSQWGLFADNGGDQKYQGEVAELWLAMGTYVDLSQPANLEKFRSAAGKPVDLGPSGATPTGLPPTIYLSSRPGEAPSQFAKNRGTGGGFWVHGALATAATSPSD